jgi:hypothetical protein
MDHYLALLVVLPALIGWFVNWWIVVPLAVILCVAGRNKEMEGLLYVIPAAVGLLACAIANAPRYLPYAMRLLETYVLR